MDVLSPILRGWKNRIYFWCPGCKHDHVIKTGPGGWTYDGNAERPTFSPSILVTAPPTPKRCHSFVRDGQIQFLSDCSHDLAGQTVPIPEWPNTKEAA